MPGEIKKIQARQIFDSRGVPTVECDIKTEGGLFRASVPSGTSAGRHEALELRDKGELFAGKSVLKAVKNVNEKIAPKLIGQDCTEQLELDKLMIELDGSDNKSNLGANAILAVSMALCRSGACANDMQLFEYIEHLSNTPEPLLPVPLVVVLEGGTHASKSVDLQEFMAVPFGNSFSESFEKGVNVYHSLKKMLKEKGSHTNVGKEGAFAPTLDKNEDAFELITKAIEKEGFKPGKDVAIALDSAASEFFEEEKYNLRTENKKLSSVEMIDYYEKLIDRYPIISIEDGLAEDDWEGWIALNKRLGGKIKIVGDDLTVTNKKRFQRAIDLRAINSILIKLNQIGTVSETIEVVNIAKEKKFTVMISHRSGETEDSFIADLVVGLGTGICKFGAPARSDRNAKYNQLLRIEEQLQEEGKAVFAGENILK